MAFNEQLSDRIREALLPYSKHIEEKRMFGGIAFMYKNKMSCGVVKNELMIRILEEPYQKEIEGPFTREMDFTKRPMKGFMYVHPDGFKTKAQLDKWLTYGIEHAELASKKK